MKPTHKLKMLQKSTKAYNEVGAGWQNADGSISVVLGVGIVLDWHDRLDCVLTLFPIDREKAKDDALPGPPV